MAQLDESNLNPLALPLRKAEDSVAKLAAQKHTLEKDLQWFRTINRDELSDKLHAAYNLMNSLKAKVESLNAELAARQRKLDNVASSIRTPFNPKNWFASDQREYRHRHKHLQEIKQELESVKTQLLKRLQDVQNEIAATSSTIKRYDAFDTEAHQRTASDLNRQIASEKAKLERLRTRKAEIDRALAPVVNQMRDLEIRKQQALRERNRANGFDNKLSLANNSYEKAMIHQQCERELGDGSPRKIMGQKDREIKRFERDYEKAQKRARRIADRASRIINSIVIDGNNLCYDNNGFIGFSALEAIVPLLDSDYALIVVFDASIRRILETNDDEIKRHFPNHVQVHVVATSIKADETVLDLAEHDTTRYILSNDRFGEFNDKRAVRDKRVIRHEIVDGRILIHDLGLNITYLL